MKILQVVPYFYPAWSYGGPAKVVYDMCRHFVSEGHQVTVFTSDSYDEYHRMPQEKRIKPTSSFYVHYFRNIFNTLTYRYNIFAAPELFLRAMWAVPKMDVVHLHDFYTPGNLWIAFLCRVFSKPYLLSAHGCLESERVAQRSTFKKVFLACGGKWLLRHATTAIALSKNEAKAYLEYGVKKENIKLVGHGIDPKEFTSSLSKTEAKLSWKVSSSDFVIAFVGRIHKIKGLDLLVKASVLLNSKKSLRILIAGPDDGYLEELKQLIRSVGAKNIRLLGTCFGKRKADLFGAADVFVYPSYSEGFSLGILEAGSVGLPLVITTGCHFAKVQTSHSGLVVAPTVEAVAEGLQKMIDDAQLRQVSGKNIRALVAREYSMDKVGSDFLHIYQQAASPLGSIV